MLFAVVCSLFVADLVLFVVCCLLCALVCCLLVLVVVVCLFVGVCGFVLHLSLSLYVARGCSLFVDRCG